ncbi:signal peptide peptidase SppA [bacterium]|nr:signal peptide peptidase SppA [candidate division CSSED10-310 bacterium]
MKKFFTILFVVLGLVTFLSVLAGAGIGVMVHFTRSHVPENSVMVIDFQNKIVEFDPSVSLAKFLYEDTLTVRDVVDAIDAASSDQRIKGLVARIGSGGLGGATMEEFRSAVGRFRKSGKFTVAYAETFGEVSSGNGTYFLSTAFEEIYMQPSGDVGLTGLYAESLFLKGLFEKLGLEPRMDHRHEYKNAMNTFTEKQFDSAHRESMQSIVDSIFSTFVREMAGSRKIPPDQMDNLIDNGPYLGIEALDAGLVDGLMYRDEVLDLARSKSGGNCDFVSLNRYIGRMDRPHSEGETVALIYGLGGVQRGDSSFDPLSGDMTMGSDTVSKAFRSAVDDEDVKAIIFRVDSPGGSYVASDTIWRETVRARDSGKPVIVTMGNVAASGGYFVSMAADKIIAQPTTLTGSIGVLGGKFLTGDLWNKTGITWDHVQTSENASMWTGLEDYSDKGWERFQAWLDRVYSDFTQKVASGRDIPHETVLEIAKGRVWTGEQALENGLIDALGGFETAVDLARESIGAPPGTEINLVVYPKRRFPFEELFMKKSDIIRQSWMSMIQSIRKLGPVVRILSQMGRIGEPDALLWNGQFKME